LTEWFRDDLELPRLLKLATYATLELVDGTVILLPFDVRYLSFEKLAVDFQGPKE